MFIDIAEEDWNDWLQRFTERKFTERKEDETIDSQAWRGVASLLRWLNCLGREKGSAILQELCQDPVQMRADIEHSLLLLRLLQGKEPLLYPPPLRGGYPWYELIETGEGTGYDVVEMPKDGVPHLLINQSLQWRILEKIGLQEWIVTYRKDGERFRVWKDPASSEGRCWRLKKLAG